MCLIILVGSILIVGTLLYHMLTLGKDMEGY